MQLILTPCTVVTGVLLGTAARLLVAVVRRQRRAARELAMMEAARQEYAAPTFTPTLTATVAPPATMPADLAERREAIVRDIARLRRELRLDGGE